MFERFFDETGGMQLVVHSPFGGRVNRSLGLALRKKFCRTFNFELQAAASDDAIVLSLGPHHSFPLQEVPGYLSSATIEDTLEHAILDSPMFQARWRWNLNRSLMVLRFRNGRRNPPPIQRMESDDLMAAVFPQAAACQENVTGPDRDPRPRARAPDRRRHAARGARRRRHPRRCSSGIEAGHRAGALRRHHRAVGARARDHHRPALRVPRRRGVPEPPHQCGHAPARARRRPQPRSARSIPTPSSRCTARSRPSPSRADDLADLLASLVVVRAPARLAARCSTSCAARGRAVVFRPRGARPVVRDRTRGRRAATPSPTTRRRSPPCCAATSRSAASPPCRRLAAATTLTDGSRAGRARLPRAERVRAAGHTTADGARATPSGCRDACSPACTRTHAAPRAAASSRRPRKTSCASCCAGSTSPRARSSAARSGCSPVVEQLQGFDAAAVAWEPDLLGARLRRYEPAWLDRLCHDGEVAWLRINPPAPRGRRARGRAVEGHADLGGRPGRSSVVAHGRARRRRSGRTGRRRDRRGARGAARARRVLRQRARRRHQPAARRHRARAVGRRRPRVW